MRLNDPFGRVDGRRQSDNGALKPRLLAEGVDDVAAVEAVAQRIARASLFMAIMIVALLTALLLPQWRGMIGLLGSLSLLCSGATLFRTRMHLRQYRRELGLVGASPQAARNDNNATRGRKP